MNDHFSPNLKEVLVSSKEEALRLGHEKIGTEHFVLGIIGLGKGKAISLLELLEVDLKRIKYEIEKFVFKDSINEFATRERDTLELTKQAEKVLRMAFLEAKLFQSRQISTIHLLLCILRNENDPISKLFKQLFNIDYPFLKKEFILEYKEELNKKENKCIFY